MLKKSFISVESKSEIGVQKQNGKEYKYIKMVVKDSSVYLAYFILCIGCITVNMIVTSFTATRELIKRDMNINDGKLGLLSTMHYVGSFCGKLIIKIILFYIII